MIDLGFEFDPAAVATAYTTHNVPVLAFADLLAEHGFKLTEEIDPSWTLTRIYDCQDRQGGKARSGWYLYSEFAEEKTGAVIGVGVFGSWHGEPEKVTWCSKKLTSFSPQETRLYMERLEIARAEREAAIIVRQGTASGEVMEAWGNASVNPETHSYCTRKGISPLPREARIMSHEADNFAGWLVVPVQDCNAPERFSSAQYISADGSKFFHPGGKIKGCFTMLNSREIEQSDTIYVCEGFATGQTVRDASGCQVYVAFNAGNLTEVAAYVRGLNPNAEIIIAGDNDHESKVGNTGKHAADAAAAVCNGVVMIQPDEAGMNDYNDWSTKYGQAKVKELLADKPEAKKPATSEDKPSTAIDGMIRMTLDWIQVNSFYPQPELGLLNVIACIGAVCGRRYKLEDYGTRTNIYTLGIAPTGMGKDNSRQRVKELLRLAGLQDYIGADEIRSGPGLLDHVSQKPAMLYQVDEFGMFLKAMCNANSPGYAQTIPAILTKLYSSSGSSYETGNLKGDEGLPPSIQEPCLSLYGTTTESTYADAMKASAIASGEMNRYLIAKAKVNFPEPNKTMCRMPPPDMLLRHWVAFKPVIGKEPIVVKLGMQREGLMRLRDYQREMQIALYKEGLDGIFARYFENTMKVAMILAIARNPQQPMLEHDIITYAAGMVEESLSFVLTFARDKMFETEDHKKLNKVVDLIRTRGGECARREIMRVLHFTAKEMDSIEDSLGIESGSGMLVFDKKARPVVYRLFS